MAWAGEGPCDSGCPSGLPRAACPLGSPLKPRVHSGEEGGREWGRQRARGGPRCRAGASHDHGSVAGGWGQVGAHSVLSVFPRPPASPLRRARSCLWLTFLPPCPGLVLPGRGHSEQALPSPRLDSHLGSHTPRDGALTVSGGHPQLERPEDGAPAGAICPVSPE